MENTKEDLKWYQEYRKRVLGITESQQGFLKKKKFKKKLDPKKKFK
jgi:hypothetical protein